MTKQELYDYLCRNLTDYEEGKISIEELYTTLIILQNNWEETIGFKEK